jgi:HD-like signal output (HDOD) protein
MDQNPDFIDDLQRMDVCIRKTVELHTAPQIARSILNLLREGDYDVREIVECLEADPALAARILKTVNSSLYGLLRPVQNLRQAVAYLGQRSLRMIATTFSLVEGLTRGSAADLYYSYWQRAITMATVAGRLTESNRTLPRNDAYTAGLLADLGILLLAQAETQKYPQLYRSVPHGPELIAAERRQFGFSHAALGARLLQNWGFPAPLVEAALHHHEDRPQALPHEAAVRAADLMADVLWTPQSSQVALARQVLEEGFACDLDAFIALAQWCRQEVQTHAEVFGIRFRETIDCDAIRAAAQRLQESASAPESAAARGRAEEARLANHLAGPPQTTQPARHLGRAVFVLTRDVDLLRQPIDVEFEGVSTFLLSLRIERPLALREQVYVHVRNEVQRFTHDLRGVVRSIQQRTDKKYVIEIEMCSPLPSPEIAAFKRAGVGDKISPEKAWI